MKNLLRIYTLIAGLLCLPAVIYAHGLDFAVQQIPDDEFAAIVEGENYTIGQLKILLGLRHARYIRDEPLYYGLNDLQSVTAEIPAYEILAREARESGVKLSEETEEQIHEMVDDYTLRLVFLDRIAEKLTIPTMQRLRDLYGEIKDEQFRTAPKYLYQQIQAPFDTEEEEPAAREKINNAMARLAEGASFPEVAREASGRAASRAELLPVEDAGPDQQKTLALLESLEDRTYSEPFVEGNAWRLVYRQMYIPEGYLSFQSTVNRLVEIYQESERQELVRNALTELADNPDLFIVHEENLIGSGELALESDILVTVCGHHFTRRDLMDAAGWRFSREGNYRRQEVRDVALSLGIVQNPLIKYLGEQGGYATRQEVSFYRKVLEETELTRALLLRDIDTTSLQPGSEEVLDAYTREAARLGDDSVTVFYDRLSLPLADVEDSTSETLTQIGDYRAFQDWARDVSSKGTGTAWMSGIREAITVSPEPVLRACVRGVESAAIAYENDDKMIICWIDKAGYLPKMSEADETRISKVILDRRLQQIIDSEVQKRIEESKSEWILNIYN